MSTDSFWRYFYEIYDELPRQGPGDRETTEQALGMLPPLGPEQRILDIGCGSGAQTIDLARATPAAIVAVDNHARFVDRLAARATELGLGDRIDARLGDMNDLPFDDGAFDVVWSEGAIFIIGFAQGLERWRRLLVPGGHLVVSEFCWFRADPPAELREIHLDGYADAGDVAARRKSIAEARFEPVGELVVPAAGWWENYYVPLAARLDRFRAAHAGNPEALGVAAHCQREIDLYRQYPDYFGYVFFVLRAT